jgi:hypothetical protein
MGALVFWLAVGLLVAHSREVEGRSHQPDERPEA